MYDRPILAIIRNNLDSEGKLPRDFNLPKDPDDESGIPFADGAQDGITYFHMQPRKLSDEEADLLIDALNAMVGGHADTADELFLKLTKTRRALEFGGGLCDIVEENASIINPIHAYSYGMHLVTMAKDKELVKIGLALHHKATEDKLKGFKQIITDLAYCNEFTWFCLPIIQKWDGGNDLIFEIAIRKYLNQAQNFKLSPDDYEVIKTIEERWDRDELIARLCEDLIYIDEDHPIIEISVNSRSLPYSSCIYL